MAMNDQQLIDYVRAQTKVRAVQVADKFDVDLEDARERLNALVDAGDLKISDGFSPNGMACKVYDVAATTGPRVGTARQTTVPAVAQVIADSPLRLAPPNMQGGRTKVQCAIDYLADKGEATVDDLRVVMDLDRHMSPTSYLAAALRDGRIVKEGNIYRLGDGKPVGRNAPRQPRTQPPPIAPRTPEPATPQTTHSGSALRIGLWSDGVIELQRDGKTVACIDQHESEHLLEFLATAKVPKVA